jgi:hypothetical protein
MLEIHDRTAELTSAPVKREGAEVEKGSSRLCLTPSALMHTQALSLPSFCYFSDTFEIFGRLINEMAVRIEDEDERISSLQNSSFMSCQRKV